MLDLISKMLIKLMFSIIIFTVIGVIGFDMLANSSVLRGIKDMGYQGSSKDLILHPSKTFGNIFDNQMEKIKNIDY